ncbi:MFS family permease [Nonomuraea angiospora]|uniref:MFS family permease n=1 Tax=Nonomuraea angiospora TaxID=46172 RepID=A0ABR9MH99_9ACTN|nr:MFS family permease [Nonomuraea angiospora]
MSPKRYLVVAAYLASHLLSLLGNGLAAVALPLIVLQTTGSPLGTAALAAATAVPTVLVGLLGGVVIDRINRRTASVVSDVISAVSVAALPLVDLLWGLDLVWFIVLGILGSFGDVPGMTAREVLVPMVARHAVLDLTRLVGLRQTVTSAALVVGPAAAGVLLATFDATSVLWVTAATSAVAALLTRTLPRRLGEVEANGSPRRSMLRELGESNRANCRPCCWCMADRGTATAGATTQRCSSWPTAATRCYRSTSGAPPVTARPTQGGRLAAILGHRPPATGRCRSRAPCRGRHRRHAADHQGWCRAIAAGGDRPGQSARAAA